MNQTLEDGMLLPGPSEPGPSNEDANEDRLLNLDGQFESGQQLPDCKRRQREGKNSIIPNKEACYDRRNASALKKKIQGSKSLIQKLKVHTKKKTCPKDLGYKLRANIAPDEDFIIDISRI